MPLGGILFFFLKNVPVVDFMYRVFTRMPGGVTVDDSGLCCCVPCLSSAVIFLCLWIQRNCRLRDGREKRERGKGDQCGGGWGGDPLL